MTRKSVVVGLAAIAIMAVVGVGAFAAVRAWEHGNDLPRGTVTYPKTR